MKKVLGVLFILFLITYFGFLGNGTSAWGVTITVRTREQLVTGGFRPISNVRVDAHHPAGTFEDRKNFEIYDTKYTDINGECRLEVPEGKRFDIVAFKRGFFPENLRDMNSSSLGIFASGIDINMYRTPTRSIPTIPRESIVARFKVLVSAWGSLEDIKLNRGFIPVQGATVFAFYKRTGVDTGEDYQGWRVYFKGLTNRNGEVEVPIIDKLINDPQNKYDDNLFIFSTSKADYLYLFPSAVAPVTQFLENARTGQYSALHFLKP